MNQVTTRENKKTLKLLIFIFGTVVAFIFGENVSFSEQWPLFEALRTTAAIIFAVVGAWLAIIYPEQIKKPFKETKEKQRQLRGFDQLFSPIESSAFILCIILVVGIVYPIAKQIAMLQQYAWLLRTLSFMLLINLTIWQMFTVIMTLSPAINMRSKYRHDLHVEEIKSSLEK